MTLTSEANNALDQDRPLLTVTREFSTEGVHPYDEIEWEKRDVIQKKYGTDTVVFEQRDVEFPVGWSETASTIVTTKYFRGALGTPAREVSLKQVIDRVVGQYAKAAVDYGYMSEVDAEVFGQELTWLLVNQYFSFNSPVWFNVGTTSPQQVSACFILSVDDSMDSILNWYKEEGFIFKGGSGAGLNLSRIRSSKELLKSGGTASGPVSFMRGADASAGTIKSGGATRRAAKMVVLDVDHPDIEEFIETKAREENKIRALRDAGFDMDLGGKDITSVQYQNANNSVRVSDEFMQAVVDGTDFGLRARTDGSVIETVDARDLWKKIATAAWECADPGLQYDDTINDWHTLANTGRITASNPCSEYMSIDNSSCNLASLNLLKFLGADGTFDVETFTKAVRTVITAMEISISFADFPTEPIDINTRKFRQLGIGYANLGALLMSKGLGYDTEEGRTLAAAITSLMTGAAYRRSAEIASVVGAYDGYAENEAPHTRVMVKHRDAASLLFDVATGTTDEQFVGERIATASDEAAIIAEAGLAEWDLNLEIGHKYGWRNAQASVLAPTGTIGFMMDCDTTGIEPDFSLVKFKKMVGGGFLQIVNNSVPRALATLGYTPEQAEEISAYITEHGHVVGAPHMDESDYPVFDCAAGDPRYLGPMGHVRMMAACQPFLSGAISKTVNLPETATVEEIADIYLDSWRLGLKATAVYRDNCKVGQPLSNDKSDTKDNHKTGADAGAAGEVVERIVEKVVEIEKIVEVPRRAKMPRSRQSTTTSFKVGEADGYLTAGQYADGDVGEIFLKMSKQGSTMAGVMDALSVAISIGLQYGVPLETYVAKFINQRFEPSGLTDDPDIRMATSLIDYIVRRLALDHLPFDVRGIYGIYSADERKHALDNDGVYVDLSANKVAQDEVVSHDIEEPVTAKVVSIEIHEDLLAARASAEREAAPVCDTCATNAYQQRSGSCFACRGCGNTTGCS